MASLQALIFRARPLAGSLRSLTRNSRLRRSTPIITTKMRACSQANWKANVILHLYGTMLSALMEKVFIHFTVTITACSLATRVHVPRCLDSTVVVVRPCIQCNGSGLTGRLYKVKDFPARVGNNEKSALYRMVRGSFCKHVLSEFTPKSLGTSRGDGLCYYES